MSRIGPVRGWLNFASLVFVWFGFGMTLHAQNFPPGPPASMTVSASSVRMICSDQMQLTAVIRDVNGNIRTGDSILWTSSDSNVLSVDALGKVTAKTLGFAQITARFQVQASIRIQVLPSKLVLTSAVQNLFVGEQSQYKAAALDSKGDEIPGLTFNWDVLTALGNPSVSLSVRGGLVKALAAGKFRVHAFYLYNRGEFGFINQLDATADLEVKIKYPYAVDQVLATSTLVANPLLKAKRTLLAGNDQGQLAFYGGFENVSNGIVLYDGGSLNLLSSAGTPTANSNAFVYDFDAYLSLNGNGEVLARHLVAFNPSALAISSKDGTRYVALENESIRGIDFINNFYITRSSLNDSGQVVFRAGYRNTGETVTRSGLFRAERTGDVNLIVSLSDGLPGLSGNLNLENEFGITRDGITFFRATDSTGMSAIFQQSGFDPPSRVIGLGDTVGNFTINSFVGAAYPVFLVAPSGDLAVSVFPKTGSPLILHYPGGDTSVAPKVIQVPAISAINWAQPGRGLLFYGNIAGRGWGLFIWGADNSIKTILLNNSVLANGEPVLAVDGATMTPDGQVTAIVRTKTHPFMVMQVGSSSNLLFESGTQLPFSANVSFTDFVQGAKTGNPYVVTGGNQGNLAELTDTGLNPLLTSGDRMDPGVDFFGAFTANVRRSSNGDLYVSVNPYGFYFPNYGIYKVVNGSMQEVLKFNLKVDDGTTLYVPGILAANDAGALVFAGGCDKGYSRMYLLQNGRLTLLAGNSTNPAYAVTVEGVDVITGWNDVILDANGRVAATLRFRNGLIGTYLFQDGRWIEMATGNRTRIGNTLVSSVISLKTAAGRIFGAFTMFGGGSTLAEYVNGSWTPLFTRDDQLPNGQLPNSIVNFDVNNNGDILMNVNIPPGAGLVLKNQRGLSMVSFTNDLTKVENQLLRYTTFDMRDDGTIYFMALDVLDRHVLFRAVPLQ
jgi:hypothetical protein